MILKKTPFWKKVAIYCAIWIAVILLALIVTWNIVLQYEKSQPEYAVERFLADSRQYIFYYVLMQTYPDISNQYESIYDVAYTLSREFDGSLTYARLVREYTYENPVYVVKNGDHELFKLTLETNQASGIFNFKSFRVKSASLIDRSVASPKSFLLVYPDNASVYINNKSLIEKAENFSDAYPFGNKSFNTIVLENFFEPPNVVVMRGALELPLAEDSAHLVYDYTAPKLRNIRITVPKTAKVIVNGATLDNLFVVDTAIAKTDILENSIELTQYNVPVSDNITVDVEYNGQITSVDENEGAYTLSPDTYDCSVTVPHGAVLYADGKKIADSLISNDNAMYTDSFTGLDEYPTAVKYEFPDLYSLPDFTATADGKELTNIGTEAMPVFVKESSEELKTKYSELAIDFMKRYLTYTTKGEKETRENLSAVLACSAPGSLLYNNLEASFIGYIFIPAQKLKTEYITADNFIPLGENAFLCDVSYKIHLSNFVGNSTEENSFRLAFALTDGKFAAVNMTSK